MKRKLLLIINIMLMFSLMNCSSFDVSSEKWEGITDHTLRVSVSEYISFDENARGYILKQMIMDKLNQRASLIIACHLSLNLSRDKISHDSDVRLNTLINQLLTGGKLRNFSCNEENYCTADSEYNVSELLKALNEINTQ